MSNQVFDFEFFPVAFEQFVISMLIEIHHLKPLSVFDYS